MRTFPNYATAVSKAKPGHRVNCVMLKDGTPVYFTSARVLSDEQMIDKAFLVREGRPRTDIERKLRDIAVMRAASNA